MKVRDPQKLGERLLFARQLPAMHDRPLHEVHDWLSDVDPAWDAIESVHRDTSLPARLPIELLGEVRYR